VTNHERTDSQARKNGVKGKKNWEKGGIKFPKKARKVPKMDKKGNLFNKLFFIQKSIQIIQTIEKLKYLLSTKKPGIFLYFRAINFAVYLIK
jgi:hypothetical protein